MSPNPTATPLLHHCCTPRQAAPPCPAQGIFSARVQEEGEDSDGFLSAGAGAGVSTLNLQLRGAVVAISPCCWQCTEPSLHPPTLASTGEGRVGWCWAGQRNKDTWFLLLSFKEHLFLGKVLGPRVAGGAAGSAWRRHGRFCCAFLKKRKKEETSQPPHLVGTSAYRDRGWAKTTTWYSQVMTRFSLLPTKPNQTGQGTEGCRLFPALTTQSH